MRKVHRALLSVFNKEGLVEFSRGLKSMGVELISTGGTASLLAQNGVETLSVSEVTGFPEILDGRVKTLHPKIHGAILAKRGELTHKSQLVAHGIKPIDMVVINLYPFEKIAIEQKSSLEDAIENIDIGGPAMLRAAAKNYEDVAAVADPQDYTSIIEEMKANDGRLGGERKLRLAFKAFAHTSKYDSLIASYFEGLVAEGDGLLPSVLNLRLEKVQNLRYGENPHQRGAFYATLPRRAGSLASANKLSGKELSYNNIADLDAAVGLIAEFSGPAAVFIKHANPCGVALGQDHLRAYIAAREADPVSAFGAVVALNGAIDEKLAREVTRTFIEAIIAPSFGKEASSVLREKKNLIILENSGAGSASALDPIDGRCVNGGMLIQGRDLVSKDEENAKVVTKKAPSKSEMADLCFAWRVAKHVKSNAIVFAKDFRTVGIGAGQMSRVDSVRMAAWKAGASAAGAVMASDAFFPFRDGIDEAARAGITAVIQPGGSMRDSEAIEAADSQGMAMIFTGVRHFRH